jgi:predicted nucleic acid-binding protein
MAVSGSSSLRTRCLIKLKTASGYSTKRLGGNASERVAFVWSRARQRIEGGRERISTIVAVLIDTNLLVYRFDPRVPRKQRIAEEVLRRCITEESARVPHQAVLEFFAVVTRPIKGGPSLLPAEEAFRETEELLVQFPVLYPNDRVVRTALRGVAVYQLSWFDAHLWAYAEVFGISELLSEDFQHNRLYGTVRVINPFVEEST